MRITCPHCGFYKEIAAEQIPANVVRVTCPDCRQPFALAEQAEVDPAPETDADASAAAPPERSDAPVGYDPDAPEAPEQAPEAAAPANRFTCLHSF